PYGFGWEVGKLGSRRQVKHAGTMLGFRAQFLRFPDDGLSVVVLTNATQAMPEKIALGVAARYLPELAAGLPARKAALVETGILDAYAGEYGLPGNRVLT